MSEDIFIGREKELQMIDEMVSDPTGASHVFPIIGAGGVGKTWLFREINRRYKDDPDVLVMRLEFGNIYFQNLTSLLSYLMAQLQDYIPEEQRLEYLRRISEWQHLSTSMSGDEKQQQIDEIYKSAMEFLIGLGERRRILALADTTETIKPPEYGYYINSFSARAKNTVLVAAGRPVDSVRAIYAKYPEIYQGWIVHDVHSLEPFSEGEVNKYFECQLVQVIEPELQEKIHILTNGNPVLIAIAGEWLKHHIKLPDQIDLPLSSLRTLNSECIEKLRHQFEFALIDKVRALSKPIDWAVLFLAYLNRRYDPAILKSTLEISNDSELDTILGELQTLSFVRKSMTVEGGLLHDEAQRLIREHAWPAVDPDGSMRRDLALKVIQDYYLPEIKHLRVEIRAIVARAAEQSAATPGRPVVPPIPDEELLKQTLQIECLDYQLRVGEENGFAYLDQLLEEAQKTRSNIFMDAITQAIYNLAPQKESAEFQSRVAEMFLARKQVERAVGLARAALSKPDVQPFEAARAWNVLGQAMNEAVEREAHFKVALERARLAEATELQATILQNLGLLYRRTGRWGDAEESYRQALRLLDPAADGDWYANILNNLAYVLMLNGQLDRADTLAERALRARRDLGSRSGLAFSHFTKGRIADAKGDYAGALRNYRTALEWFKSISDEENIAWVQVDMAQAERRSHRFHEARRLLVPALESTRPDIRAEALSQVAKVAIDEAEAAALRRALTETVHEMYAVARVNALAALTAAESLGDVHLQAVELFDLALITFLAEHHADTERIQSLETLLADHDFPLERAHLAELRGSLAYTQGDFSKAFEHYLEACRILADYSIGRFRRVFERVRARFMDAPLEAQAQVCQLWTPALQDIPPQSPLRSLQVLCLDDLGL